MSAQTRAPRRSLAALAVPVLTVALAAGACGGGEQATPDTTAVPPGWDDRVCAGYDALVVTLDATDQAAAAPVVPGTNARDALSGTLEAVSSTVRAFTQSVAMDGAPEGLDTTAVETELAAFDERSLQRTLPRKVTVNGDAGDDPATTPVEQAALAVVAEEIRTDLAVSLATLGATPGGQAMIPELEDVEACTPLVAALRAPVAGAVPPVTPVDPSTGLPL